MISKGGVFIIKFIKDIFNKGNFKDYFKRNKVFLIVSVLVIFLSLLSGFYDSSTYANMMDPAVTQITSNTLNSGNLGGNFISFFISNIINKLYAIVMGLSFSVLAVLSIVSNTVSIGFLFNQHLESISLLMPHNIFLIITNIFTLCGALLVTKMEVRLIAYITNRKKNPLSRLKVPFKDLILTITFIIILLIIASLLEAVLIPLI